VAKFVAKNKEMEGLQPPDGVYFDELSKIRLMDTEKYQQTEELREQCKLFVESMILKPFF
jgi:hypothetical protein